MMQDVWTRTTAIGIGLFVWLSLAGGARANGGEQEAFLMELARAELTVAAERDFEGAEVRLAALWREACAAAPFEGEWELLIRVVEARAKILLQLGRPAEARVVLARLIDAPEGAEVAAAERAALADERLEALRKAVHAAESGIGQEGDDELRYKVSVALEEGNAAFIATLGIAAVPALVAIVEGGVDDSSVPRAGALDAMQELIDLAELRAARVIRASFERGNYFWRKRALKAMQVGQVLTNPGTWEGGPPPRACREPDWIAVLELLASDPQHLRGVLPLIGDVARQGFTTGPLNAALVACARSDDPDLVADALQLFDQLSDPNTTAALLPVYEELLGDAAPRVRRVAGVRLMRIDRVSRLIGEVDSEDPQMRRFVAAWYRNHRHPDQWDERDRANVEKLVADADSDTRVIAVALVTVEHAVLSDAAYRRMAADPREEIRAAVAGFPHPDAKLMAEVLTLLAQDDSAEVLDQVDRRLKQADEDAPAFLPVLEARWANAARPLPKDYDESVVSDFALFSAGVVALARRFLEADDLIARRALLNRFRGDESAIHSLTALERDQLAAFLRRAEGSPADEGNFLRNWSGQLASAQPPPVEAMRALARSTGLDLAVRVRALHVLAEVSDDGFEEALFDVLHDPAWGPLAWQDPHVRALWALGSSIERKHGNALLLRVVRDRATDDRAAQALASYLEAGAEQGREVVLAVLERWFDPQGERVDVVNQALWNLAQFPESVDPALLTAAAKHEDYVEAAIGAMARLRDPRYLSVLGECLDVTWGRPNRRGKIEVQAAQALSRYLTDEASQQLLEGVARTSNEDTRQACFTGLERIRKYLDEKDELASRRLGKERRERAIAELHDLLDDPDAAIVAEAARGLGTLGAAELLPELIGLLRSEHATVRAAAREALDRINADIPAPGGEDG